MRLCFFTFTIYLWPASLIKYLERSIKNCIWSGDISKTKLVTVTWAKVCKPLEQGGLGITFLSTLNKALNFKLCWDLLSFFENWVILLRGKVLRDGIPIKYHIDSCILSSIKSELDCVTYNIRIVLGNGCKPTFGLIFSVVLLLWTSFKIMMLLILTLWFLISYITVLGVFLFI